MTARTIALVGYGVAVVLGVTSAVLFTRSRGPEVHARARCAPALAGAGAAGVLCAGRF